MSRESKETSAVPELHKIVEHSNGDLAIPTPPPLPAKTAPTK